MLRPQINIKIGQFPGVDFTYCQEVKIETSRDSFTRTASIVLPQRFYKKYEKIINVISIGDPVVIDMGFYPNLENRFNGYVTRRVPDSPLQLSCEDESWQYKNRFIDPVTVEDATLESFIKKIYTGKIGTIADGSRKIGDWRVAGFTTFIKALDTLRNTFGITAFWDLDGALNIDAQLEQVSTVNNRIFDFNINLISTEGMNYQEAAEYSQVVFYSSIQEELLEDGTPKPTVEVYAFYDKLGRPQVSELNPGVQGNINRFTIPYFSAAELKPLALTRLKALNFTGYRGGFVTFGEPITEVNDDCQIRNTRSPEMDGRYRVKAVNVSYGINTGYKQEIEVARKTG
jgi:hypothetical protein